MPRLPYPKLAPEPYAHMTALGHYLNTATTLDPILIELVRLRASILNRCNFCTGMHAAELRKHHEPDSRIEAIAHWQDTDAFTLRERAALAWTDVLTQLPGNEASDDDYAAVLQFFADKDLVDLTWTIAQINAWNRMGIAFAAEWNPPHEAATQQTPPNETISAVNDDGGKVEQD